VKFTFVDNVNDIILRKNISMCQEAKKLELINWFTRINDKDTLKFLNLVMDSKIGIDDWGDELTQEQLAGIKRGLNDLDNWRFVSHSDVKKKIGAIRFFGLMKPF